MGEHAAEVAEKSSGNIVTNNPNAAVALGSGSGIGAIVIWIAQVSGAHIPPEIAAIVGGAIASVALFIGKSGVKGIAELLWRGKGS